ncbi:MAG: hypothetical protein M3P41_11445 [Actinomycetota bacterium]|nr:hypothetical protein [Actinomycetota bacterium]
MFCLLGIAVLSTALRIVLVSRVHDPIVFLDELGYQKLAQSLGRSGQLALFDKGGPSYSPLYSVVLAPIYALGASARTAYDWMKIVNAFLISLSVFPIFKIARFVLPRGESLLVAGLSALAPLMLYSSFVMSENLAYPLCLVAVWAMMEAVRAAGPRRDTVLLVSIVAASLARLQLVVLLPVALTAVVLAAALGRGVDQRLSRSLALVLRQHFVLFVSTAAVVLVAGIRVLAGHGVLSLAGRYAVVGRQGLPSPWRVLELALEHLAGLSFAVGVFPFTAALVAASVFFRSGSPRKYVPFASVAVALTAWLLLETAFDAALFDHGRDLSRIHERYLIYVVPLFLVALVAAVRLPASKASTRAYLSAAAVTTLLPVFIPFHRVINITNVVDSFGLQLLGRIVDGAYVPIPHATAVAIWISGTFALTYVLIRHRLRTVVIFVMFVFLLVSSLARTRVEAVEADVTSLVPLHRDWVDRTKPTGDVILVTGSGKALPWHETAFNNLSIARVYYLCRSMFGTEFGERAVTIDEMGRLRDQTGDVRSPYAVVPTSLHILGRVIARNVQGHQNLVATADGRVRVAAGKQANTGCGPLNGA